MLTLLVKFIWTPHCVLELLGLHTVARIYGCVCIVVVWGCFSIYSFLAECESISLLTWWVYFLSAHWDEFSIYVLFMVYGLWSYQRFIVCIDRQKMQISLRIAKGSKKANPGIR